LQINYDGKQTRGHDKRKAVGREEGEFRNIETNSQFLHESFSSVIASMQ
jgi:hypothetical protein